MINPTKLNHIENLEIHLFRYNSILKTTILFEGEIQKEAPSGSNYLPKKKKSGSNYSLNLPAFSAHKHVPSFF